MDSFFSVEGMCPSHEGTKGTRLEICLHPGLEFARGDKWGSGVLRVTVMAGRHGALELKKSISKINGVEPRRGQGHNLFFCSDLVLVECCGAHLEPHSGC